MQLWPWAQLRPEGTGLPRQWQARGCKMGQRCGGSRKVGSSPSPTLSPSQLLPLGLARLTGPGWSRRPSGFLSSQRGRELGGEPSLTDSREPSPDPESRALLKESPTPCHLLTPINILPTVYKHPPHASLHSSPTTLLFPYPTTAILVSSSTGQAHSYLRAFAPAGPAAWDLLSLSYSTWHNPLLHSGL